MIEYNRNLEEGSRKRRDVIYKKQIKKGFMNLGMEIVCRDKYLLKKADYLLWELTQYHYLRENLQSGKLNSEVNLSYF